MWRGRKWLSHVKPAYQSLAPGYFIVSAAIRSTGNSISCPLRCVARRYCQLRPTRMAVIELHTGPGILAWLALWARFIRLRHILGLCEYSCARACQYRPRSASHRRILCRAGSVIRRFCMELCTLCAPPARGNVNGFSRALGVV